MLKLAYFPTKSVSIFLLFVNSFKLKSSKKFSSIYTPYTIMTMRKILFLTDHSAIFCHSADPLKLCRVGRGPSVDGHFQASPEMFDRVHVRALAGPLKDIHRVFPEPLLCCLGCALRVIVLLGSEPSPRLRLALGDLKCSKHFFCSLPKVCASTQSCL